MYKIFVSFELEIEKSTIIHKYKPKSNVNSIHQRFITKFMNKI
jgi:gamma-glutamyl-gamma-aminobutyrate hydrolase PuuD